MTQTPIRSLLKLGLRAGLCVFALGLAEPTGAHAKSRSRAKVEARKALVADKVRAEIQRNLPHGLAIGDVDLPSSVTRRGRDSDVVALRWRRPPAAGRSVVQILVHQASGRVSKGWARVELVKVGEVVVAAVDLPAGSIIEAGHLRVEERPFADGSEVAIEPAFLVGAKVVSALRSGDTLLSDAVALPVPLPRGSAVQVVVRKGAVRVATSGQLEERSVVGTDTRVRVAGKILSGRLVSSDRVELDLGGVQ